MNALLVADLEQEEMIVKEGPGRRLRATREARGYDIAGVAEALHLSSKVVERIEADDYAALPSPVFVRGYLRNYARVVGEPGEAVLAAYDRVRPAETNSGHRGRGVTLNKAEIRSNHLLVQLMSVLILLGLAALLAIWWQGYLEQPSNTLVSTGPEPVIIEDSTEIEVIETATAPSAATAGPTDSQPLTNAESTPEAPPSSQSETSSAEVPPNSPASAPAQVAQTETPPAPTAKVEQTAAKPDAPMAAPEEGQAGVAVAAELVPPRPSTLVISLKGESWVDVRDAKGKIVFAGVLGKGAEKTLQSDGKFQLVLGNAPVVNVTVDGKPVDTGPHTKKNIARLTINPKKI